MQYEKYIRLYDGIDTEAGRDYALRPGEKCDLNFDFDEETENRSFRLFFTGETKLFYFWKGEYDCVAEYCNIEDSLNSKDALYAPYCLDLTNVKAVSYPKIAFNKVLFPPKLSYLKLKEPYSDKWRIGIFAKAENLKNVRKDAYARMVFEVRYHVDGIPAYSTKKEPDEIKTIEIPLGTYGWQELCDELILPKDKTENVMIYVETFGCKGKLLLERPYLISSNGFNVLPDFQPPYHDHDKSSWLGVNLSRKEWPEFEITLNGKRVFKGEMFERCHRYSECECEIPDGIVKNGRNALSLRLISSYPNALPYALHELGIISRPKGRVAIVGCPENAPANGKLFVLINTEKPHTSVRFLCDSGRLEAKEQYFANKGLNVFEIKTKEPANGVDFTLIADGCSADARVERIVYKKDDGVLTGTGDSVYVNQENMSDLAEYLSWYVSNGIGNMITFRPTYRWSGARVVNERNWQRVKNLCNKLGLKYVHMTDGRELPGGAANPSLKTMRGKGFLGRQSHEFDGAYIYWGHGEVSELTKKIDDCWMRLNRQYPETVNTRSAPFSFYESKRDGNLYNYLDPHGLPDDMEEAAKLLVYNENMMRMSHTRHTGPSVAFRYFFQAGYRWTGAELMYGPLEIITAFLRGAAYCYGSRSIGAHLAVQWSTTPHDTEDRYRRYRASLFSSYVQGINDINTEEGLWHLEEYYSYFNRESTACLEHKKQQQDFYGYISTHSRNGIFHTPFAFVFGRFDGYRQFGVDYVFANADWRSEAPEYSWELLDIFYPLEKANGEIYLHPCPSDREVGMLTGTPRGSVDVIPIETSPKKMQKYKVLAFLGYNKALPEDCDKLIAYVRNGGRLLLGWPHVSVTSKRDDVVNYRHEYIDHRLTDLFSDDRESFVTDTFGGNSVTVNTAINLDCAEILETTDAGIPLLLKYPLGKGNIYFVNAREYPAEKGVENIYRETIKELSDEVNAEEKAFIRSDETVQFTKYRLEDGSEEIYVLAVDWYHDPEKKREATFVFNGSEYPLKLDFSIPMKIKVKDNTALWSDSADFEAVSLDARSATVQGRGKTEIFIVNDGRYTEKEIVFGENAVENIDY